MINNVSNTSRSLPVSLTLHIAPAEPTQDASKGVREDTAELASWALSDVASIRSGRSPARHHTSSFSTKKPSQTESYLTGRTEQDGLSRHESTDSSRPGVIEELSEPASPDSAHSSRISLESSALTEMVRNTPPTEQGDNENSKDDMLGKSNVQPVTVGEGIISQPGEQTALLLRKVAYRSEEFNKYGSVQDLENQGAAGKSRLSQIRRRLHHPREQSRRFFTRATNPKSWDRKAIVEHGLRRPAGYVPPVILGLLLNVLDALSYGKSSLRWRFVPTILI